MPPLDGILVADFSRVLAGPLAAMLLGDLGADVIKVERPDGGDDTRAWGPPWRDGESTYYLGLNRNKRSIALDLKDSGDLALARTLAERSDVLIESFRPGLIAEFGLDGDSLRTVNESLVTCSVTAFGSSEAAAGMPGYDFLLQAMGGLMSVTGEPDGRPLKAGTAVVDLVCGLLAANGIQAALVERERTGRGRHVEVSLMDSALTCLLNQGTAWVAAGVRGRRRGNRHPSIVPYETYETADRPIAIAVGNERIFARLCDALGLRARRALREQRGARGPRRRARGGDRGRPARARRRPLAVGPARGEGAGGSDQRGRRGVRARRGARHGARRGRRRAPGHPAAAADRRRAPADPPGRRRASTSTAATSRAWLTGP